MGLLYKTVDVAFDVYALLIFARVLLSWFRPNPYQPVVRFIYELTDPYLRIFRRFIPPVGAVDFSPLVGLLVLQVIKVIVLRLFAALPV
ncbi:MAG TPA: YggT family protein [Desulfotomaculum sp.]|nr:YggT family protein [Desulfotomaculum sp.]